MSAAESYDFLETTGKCRPSWALNDNTRSDVYASLEVKDFNELFAACTPEEINAEGAPVSLWSRVRDCFSLRDGVGSAAATAALFITAACLIAH
jgi:hypothetical protein